MFLDWSKAFDKLATRTASCVAATRSAQPHVRNPIFEVILDDQISSCKEQKSGIRQGYTLSPLLFLLLQTVLFYDVQTKYIAKHPLSVAPQIPFFDIEFANDTILIARTREHLQDLLWYVQDKASKYNLHLNMDKTKLVLYNSELPLPFEMAA